MLLNATQSVLLQTFLLFINKDNDNANEIIVPQENTSEQCYGMYGCYKMTYPWTDESLRPVSYVPQAPEVVDPKYCLYTRLNEDRCQRLDINNTETLFRSFMMSDHRVFVITHGFLENGHKDWIQAMRTQLLKHIDASVVVVDWSSGSGPPYPQAVANIRLIGAITAHLLNNLIIFLGIRPEHIHFIGHSLGAHMAAYAGQTLHTEFGYKLGRITGLDPAEPHFSKTDPIMRLDPTDADFVDVIHTDAGPFIVSGGLGILQPIGHVDFYPNGGIEQPGCGTGVMMYMGREMGTFYRGLRKMLSCNHIRSYQYFIESINPNNCYFMGTECDSWEHFLNGTCFDCTAGNKCPFQTNIGLHADTYLRKGRGYGSALRLPPPRTHVKLYMITGPEGPFCRHHYHIVWKISDSCKSILHGGEVGMIWLTIHGENRSTEIKLSQVVQYYEPGETYHTTVAGNPIDKLESVTLRWEYHTSPWNPLTWRLIETPRIYIAWMQIQSLEHKDRMTVCPEDGRPVTSRKALPLEKRTESNMCNININTTPQECSENIH